MEKDNQFNFTRAAILALPVPSKRTPHRDLKVRAFRLIHHPTGKVTFEVFRKFKGEPYRVPLGSFDPNLPESREFEVGFDPLDLLNNNPSLNVRMARVFANAVNLELDKGIDIKNERNDARYKEKSEITLGQAFYRYRDEYLIPQGKKSVNDMVENFQRYLGELPNSERKAHGRQRVKPACAVNWENRKLSSIKTKEIDALMRAIKTDISGYTANRTHELLRATYNRAIYKKYYDGSNPCEGVDKYAETSRSRYLQAHEIPIFFEHLNNSPYPNFKDFVYLCLFTGGRKSNVLAMRWGDIDFYHKLWKVPAGKSKSKKELYIPLVEAALEILETRKGLSAEWVFPANSKTGHMWSPKKYWGDLLKEAGLSDFRIHDLRRSLGSWAANTGASLPIIGKALGHQSPESTKVYAHLSIGPVLEAMEKATKMMMKLGGVELKVNESDDPQKKVESSDKL